MGMDSIMLVKAECNQFSLALGQWPSCQLCCLISWMQVLGWLLPLERAARCLKCFSLFLFSRMTSVDINDENLGVCPPGKQHSSVNDIFNLDQPTGRPSILRQTENLPSKTVPKGTKVKNKSPLFCVLYTPCCQTVLCLWIWYYLIRPPLMSPLQAITYGICFGSLMFFFLPQRWYLQMSS